MIKKLDELIGRKIIAAYLQDRSIYLDLEGGDTVCFGVGVRDYNSPEEVMILTNPPLTYNKHFGDAKICTCGHTYYRHFDTYDRLYPIGCKYCNCDRFEEKGHESQIEPKFSKELLAQMAEMQRWRDAGYDVWIENSIIKHTPAIDKDKYGPHIYADDGTSDCELKCGCWMGASRSGGPVDPFGPCPNNPKRESNDATSN